MDKLKEQKLIILSGATGYVGFQVLVELIKRGYKVFCVGRNLEDQQYAFRNQGCVSRRQN